MEKQEEIVKLSMEVMEKLKDLSIHEALAVLNVTKALVVSKID